MAVRFKKPSDRPPTNKGWLLFLLPLPVLLAALVSLAKGNLPGLVANTMGYALYLSGALLTRRGLKDEAEYTRRKVALAPKYPLKTLGGITIALATGLTASFAARYSLPLGLVFGLGALLGYYLLYGFDPRAQKQAIDTYGVNTTDQILQTLTNAERIIVAIEEANRRIRNTELNLRLERITALARQILSVIEEDPRDLRRARKFLNVYLEGTQHVTEGYARLHQETQSKELEENYRRVLITIEEVFREQRQKLLETDIQDLDVKIEVLATQLKHEGVI
jgi:5-bromo-4-chloroindolyl phosphate hydrolysis protein